MAEQTTDDAVEDELCELAGVDDLEHAYDLRRALAERGLESDVWDGSYATQRLTRTAHRLHVMVHKRDLVYARWVAYAAGVDVWPDDTEGEAGQEATGRQAVDEAA